MPTSLNRSPGPEQFPELLAGRVGHRVLLLLVSVHGVRRRTGTPAALVTGGPSACRIGPCGEDWAKRGRLLFVSRPVREEVLPLATRECTNTLPERPGRQQRGPFPRPAARSAACSGTGLAWVTEKADMQAPALHGARATCGRNYLAPQ